MVRNELVEEVLRLDHEGRQYVYDLLSASLTGDSPAHLSAEDQAELLIRVDDFRAAPETFSSWEEVRTTLRQQRAKMIKR